MLEKRISDKIREMRKNKGLTLDQLGKEIGLSKGLHHHLLYVALTGLMSFSERYYLWNQGEKK